MSLLLALVARMALAAEPVGLSDLPPADVRLPGGPPNPAPSAISVVGPFRLVSVVGGVRSYEAPIPIRPRSLFFQTAPEGMRLLRGTVPLRYGGMLDDRGLANTWEFSADTLTVRVAADDIRPFADQYQLVYATANEREAALDPPSEASNDPAWAIKSFQIDDVTRRGVYLPVPSQIAWNLDIPAGGMLRFTAGLVPPEVEQGFHSDGANLTVWVDERPLAELRIEPGPFGEYKVDLSEYAGKTARLELRSADRDPTADHLLVGEPQVYVPSDHPKRLLMVFVDTLRRDHLGIYGYDRAPAPGIDAVAQDGVIFEDARSVAPWTLPATRAALTGVQPELFDGATSIAERLSARGWATAAYVGNIYLSSNFDMAGGWGEHGCVNWPPADLQVNRGVDFLQRHADQDALVMVHFMDLHLPYKEPFWYMRRYAEAPPADIGGFFTRTMLLRVPQALRVQLRQYLIDRYDQNLRYVDDTLGRLFEAAGPDATIAFFADHGEEFFDHGDLEHGHTLYEELLRIPMFLRSPGLAPRRVSDPVSLIDLTPTLLDLLNVPAQGLSGESLLPLARGETPTTPHAPIGFGRPLYGSTAWGSVTEGTKYVSKEGAERLYDLAADPAETRPLDADEDVVEASRAALAAAVRQPVRLAYRLTPSGHTAISTPVELRVPGGIAQAWVGDDPTAKSSAEIECPDDETLIATFTGQFGIQREVFVIPRVDVSTVTPDVTLRLSRAGSQAVYLQWAPPGPTTLTLGRVSSGGRGYQVTWGVLPLPFGRGTIGADAEMSAALQAIGYETSERMPAIPTSTTPSSCGAKGATAPETPAPR